MILRKWRIMIMTIIWFSFQWIFFSGNQFLRTKKPFNTNATFCHTIILIFCLLLTFFLSFMHQISIEKLESSILFQIIRDSTKKNVELFSWTEAAKKNNLLILNSLSYNWWNWKCFALKFDLLFSLLIRSQTDLHYFDQLMIIVMKNDVHYLLYYD